MSTYIVKKEITIIRQEGRHQEHTEKFRAREGEFLVEESECRFSASRMGTPMFRGYKAL